jgi:hypothetical protein
MIDLFSEIGPPSVERLENRSQPVAPVGGTLTENETPFSVTEYLEPGWLLVAEGDDDGESKAIPATATIATTALTSSLATLLILISSYLCAGDHTGWLWRPTASFVRFRCPLPSAFIT